MATRVMSMIDAAYEPIPGRAPPGTDGPNPSDSAHIPGTPNPPSLQNVPSTQNTRGVPVADGTAHPASLGESAPEPKKLVLCFDGTGDEFSGSNADTNVVKILNKLDRNHPSQFHYYQTGIGTYVVDQKTVNQTVLGSLKGNISKIIDQALGTSFDAHVMAGYSFLMRYYDPGDKIYLFGFSRGAFTAKFLARMIHTVGLLCKGNSEMVPFAYRLYQKYLEGQAKDYMEVHDERQHLIAIGDKKGLEAQSRSIPLSLELMTDVDGDGVPDICQHGCPTTDGASCGHGGHADDPANGAADDHVKGGTNGSAKANGSISAQTRAANGTAKANGRTIPGTPAANGGANGHAKEPTDEPPTDKETGTKGPKTQSRHSHTFHFARDEITAFSDTFCRKERVVQPSGEVTEENIKVYFLGMWECVNSVAVLERKAPIPTPVTGTAHHVRHAVAVDERRVKFKAALLAQDTRCSYDEDIKEVWFPGNHGDVGGGWPAVEGESRDEKDTKGRVSLWERVKTFWLTRKADKASHDVRKDPFQLSDIALSWMIRELEMVGKEDGSAALHWLAAVNGYKERFVKKINQALCGIMHDTLKFGGGSGFFTVAMWRIMEWLPFITRWELEDNEWVDVRFPLHGGGARDIPLDAVIHESVLWRLQHDPTYHPKNNHGGHLPPCFGGKEKLEPVVQSLGEAEKIHQTYVFAD